jgi:hypothetical protein
MLKTDPKYGTYPWWPEDGDAWLHPEDVPLARAMIPSERVFRRDGNEGPYVVMHYGDVRLRVRRTLWLAVPGEGYDVGDWVEVMSKGSKNEFRTGRIREMLWHAKSQSIRYQIEQAGLPIEMLFAADDLRPVEPTRPNTWSTANVRAFDPDEIADEDVPTID